MTRPLTTTSLLLVAWLVNTVFGHGEELLLEVASFGPASPSDGLTAALERIPQHLLAAERRAAVDGCFTSPRIRDGIPEGVDCDPVERCDSRNVCARVCARGSVRIDPWLQRVVAWQWRLSRAQPLCLAQILGTHNSAITLADGYGLHDELYTTYLRYLNLLGRGGQGLVTNNQALSLTDQLNLGVRFVELDVHWIQSGLHIAHCGGFHSPRLNALVAALSEVAAWFGHPPVEWDAETLGCSPSLSSLPARDQRLFSDAVAEVAAWLAAPGHEHEFVVLYLDDQMDLATWGRVPELLGHVTAAVPLAAILTPPELAAISREQGGAPPPIEVLVRVYGKRLLLMSATDYGAAMSHTAFNHSAPCGLAEPLFQRFTAAPECSFAGWRPGRPTIPAMAGRLLRTPTCRLTYGPYNCSLQQGDNTPQLDSELLPGAVSCGINVPAPDLLTPDLLAAAVWSWAPGHLPPAQLEQQKQQQQGSSRMMVAGDGVTGPGPGRGAAGGRGAAVVATGDGGAAASGNGVAAGAGGSAGGGSAVASGGPDADGQQATTGPCAVMRSGDGRWELRPCTDAAFAACRRDAGPAHIPDHAAEAPDAGAAAWAVVPALAACPPGYLPGAPHTARESADLHRRLLSAAAAEASEATEVAAAAANMGEVQGGVVAAAGAIADGQELSLSLRLRLLRSTTTTAPGGGLRPKAGGGGDAVVTARGGGAGTSTSTSTSTSTNISTNITRSRRHEASPTLAGEGDAEVYAILALRPPQGLPAGLPQ